MSELFDLLSPVEQRAVLALLTERTIEAAAVASDVHERTLRKWLAQREHFKAALREQKRVVREHVSARVSHASSRAIDTLVDVMNDSGSPASARVAAARVVLELAWDSDVAARLEALEAALIARPPAADTHGAPIGMTQCRGGGEVGDDPEESR